MNVIEKKLKKYIKAEPEVKVLETEYGYGIIDEKTEDFIGNIDFFEDGKLSILDFEMLYLEDDCVVDRAPVTEEIVEAIMASSKKFFNDFVSTNAVFTMLAEWGESGYIVTYEEVDEKLGIMIPHTGCTLYFNHEGYLTAAHIGNKDYTLEYPEIKVTKEEAKQILENTQLLQLAIEVLEDGCVELVYQRRPEIIGVKVDGQIDDVYKFMGATPLACYPINKITVTESLETLLGVTDDFELYESDDSTKLWAEKTKFKDKENDNEDEFEATVHTYDSETGHFSASNIPFVLGEQEQLAETELKNRALQYLELVVGKIDEKYFLEEQLEIPDFESEDRGELCADEMSKRVEVNMEEELLQVDADTVLDEGDGDNFESEEEDFLDLSEPTIAFTFIRQHRGFKLEGFNAYIHVGLYTGIIRECSTSTVFEKKLQALDVTPLVTLEEAEKAYFSRLEMKLARAVKDFEDCSTYDLTYLIDFPGENGAIEKINAHTGEIMYVETGILKG